MPLLQLDHVTPSERGKGISGCTERKREEVFGKGGGGCRTGRGREIHARDRENNPVLHV